MPKIRPRHLRPNQATSANHAKTSCRRIGRELGRATSGLTRRVALVTAPILKPLVGGVVVYFQRKRLANAVDLIIAGQLHCHGRLGPAGALYSRPQANSSEARFAQSISGRSSSSQGIDRRHGSVGLMGRPGRPPNFISSRRQTDRSIHRFCAPMARRRPISSGRSGPRSSCSADAATASRCCAGWPIHRLSRT